MSSQFLASPSTPPGRSRSASHPTRAFIGPPSPQMGQSSQLSSPSRALHARSVSRSLSSNAIQKVTSGELSNSPSLVPDSSPNAGLLGSSKGKGRARSSSLVTVTEVGGDEPEGVVDRLGVGVNENAAWVNSPGAWLIHPVLILAAKLIIDALPSMTQPYSWTIVNLGYVAVSYTMFHYVTGVPFESNLTTGGAYDDLTLWEQIDAGAQYTPSKKWLTSVPIFLFLISTHYVKYNFLLFGINFAACVFVLFPKLPVLHRLRFHFTPLEPDASAAPTPMTSHPPSPRLAPITEVPGARYESR